LVDEWGGIVAYQKYSDEQQAMFIVQLEVSGYPDNEHAPLEVSKQKGAPSARTLKRWWKIRTRPEVDKVVRDKKKDLVTALKDLLRLHIDAASEAVVGHEDLRALDTGIGILVDKLQLLDNKPTTIVKLQQAIEEGKVTAAQVRERYPSLAEELFTDAR
jgi:hypothetical protein